MSNSLLDLVTTSGPIQPFNRLRADLKGGLDIPLAPCTAIVGPARSGKTTVLDVLRLCITQKHDIGATGAALGELMPAGAEYAKATLSGPSGVCQYIQEAPGGKAKKPVKQPRGGALQNIDEADWAHVLAVDDILNMLKFGKDKAREAIMRRFGTSTEIHTPRGLTPAQRTAWEGTRNEALAANTDTSQALALMAELFRSKASAATASAKAGNQDATTLTKRLENQMYGLEQLGAWESELTEAKAWETHQTAIDRQAATQERLTNAEARVAELQASADKWDTANPAIDRTAIQADLSGIQAKRSFGELLLTRFSANGACPACLTEGDHSAQVAQLTTDVAALAVREAACKVKLATPRRNPFTDQVGIANTEVLRTTIQLEAGAQALPPKRKSEKTIDVLQAEVDRIKGVLTDKERLAELENRSGVLTAESERCKLLGREAGVQLTAHLEKVQMDAEAAVNRYMPAGFCAKLSVSPKEVQWRMIGTDGAAHKRGGMSGSELGSLVVALGCAWTEGAPLRVLLLDTADLGEFCPETLPLLLNRLKEVQQRGDLTQVIVAWNRPAEIPAGWHIVPRGTID